MFNENQVSLGDDDALMYLIQLSCTCKMVKIKLYIMYILPQYGLRNHGGWCDCSHEIKRHLLLERKVMTNLDSVLNSRNITLLTKVIQSKIWLFQ